MNDLPNRFESFFAIFLEAASNLKIVRILSIDGFLDMEHVHTEVDIRIIIQEL